MYTRNDYTNKRCTHREYYAYLAKKAKVTSTIFSTSLKQQIMQSTDKHFNDISLPTWDSYADYININIPPAEKVCLLKEVAQQYKDNTKEK